MGYLELLSDLLYGQGEPTFMLHSPVSVPLKNTVSPNTMKESAKREGWAKEEMR